MSSRARARGKRHRPSRRDRQAPSGVRKRDARAHRQRQRPSRNVGGGVQSKPNPSTPTILPFRISYVSSETPSNPASHLLTFSESGPGWSSSKYCTFPQIVIIRFPGLVRLTQLKLISHEHKITKRLELFSGSPRVPFATLTPTTVSSLTFRNASFRRLGHASLSRNSESGYQARELKIVRLGCECVFLKIVLGECYLNKRNLYSQVGIVAVQCIGRILKWLPGEKRPNGVSDGTGAATGGASMPLRDSIALDPDEEEFEAEMRELVFYKDQAARAENFLLAASYKKQIEHLQANRERIRQLQREKKLAVQDEDYLRADAIRKELDRIRNPNPNPNPGGVRSADIDVNESGPRGSGTGDRDQDRFRRGGRDRDRRSPHQDEEDPVMDQVMRSFDDDEMDDNYRENLTATTRRVFHPGEADARVHHSLVRSVDDMTDGEDQSGGGRRRGGGGGVGRRSRDLEEEEGERAGPGPGPESFLVRRPGDAAVGAAAPRSPVNKDDLFGGQDSRDRRRSLSGDDDSDPGGDDDDDDGIHPFGRASHRQSHLPYDERPIAPVRNPETFYAEAARKGDVGQDASFASGRQTALDDDDGSSPDTHLMVDFSEMSGWQQKMARVILQKLRDGECPPVRSLGKIPLSADTSVVLPLLGEFLTKCLYSTTSRHLRQAASATVTDMLHEITDANQQTVFVSMMAFLGKHGLKDRIHQVFMKNLALIEATLDFAGAGSKQSVVQSRMLPVLDELILRIGDNSKQKRDESRRVLFGLCRRPYLGPSYVISRLLKMPKKRRRAGPRGGGPATSMRELVAKVEAVRDFVVDFGFGEETGLSLPKLMTWLSPTHLGHVRNEIRSVAVEVMVLAYKHFETEFQAQGGLKGVPQKVFFSKYCKGIESIPLRKELIKKLGFEFEEVDRRGIPPIQELPRIQQQQQQPEGAEKKGRRRRRRRKKHEYDAFFFWVGEEGLMYGPKQPNECPFCRAAIQEGEEEGEEDESETHYLEECPMITTCPLCDYVIPIPHMDHHLVYTCSQKTNVECCPKCKVPQLKPEYSGHVQSGACDPRKPLSEANRCYLCHEDILPGIEGWRKHLMVDYCPSNERTVDKTEIELGGDTSKKELTSRMLEV